MAAGPASYGMTDTMGRMHSDAQFAGSSSVPAHVEMMGLIGAGNNPMVGMTVAVAVSIEEAAKEGKEVILHNNKLVDSSRIKWARKMIKLYETYKSLGQNLFNK